MAEYTVEEQIAFITERVEKRNEKIKQVKKTQIQNRKEIVARIQKNIEKFEGHITRWEKSNERDLKKIEALRTKESE